MLSLVLSSKDKTISNIQEIKARKGIIVSLGPKDDSLKKISDYFFELNYAGLEELSPLYVNVVNQLLSYYMAKFKWELILINLVTLRSQ